MIPTTTTLSDYDLSGHVPGCPPRNPVSLVDGPEMDREIAESIPCEVCGARCEYRPYVAEHSHTSEYSGQQVYSYRSFAVCTACGHATEF